MLTIHRTLPGLLIAIVIIALDYWWQTPHDEREMLPATTIGNTPIKSVPNNKPELAKTDTAGRHSDMASLSYCNSENDSTQGSHDNTAEFITRHPELGMTQADIALIRNVISEISEYAAETITDVDATTQRVTRTGRFYQQDVAHVAAAAESDAEAALIYGSHLMHIGMVGHDNQINLTQLQAGERLLQLASARYPQAIRRIYFSYNFASIRAWRKGDSRENWQQADTARAAYRQWLQQHGSAAEAILLEQDTWYRNAEAQDGTTMPVTEDNAAAAVMARLSLVERALPTTAMTPEQSKQREHILWLNRRGGLDHIFMLMQQDCSAPESGSESFPNL